MSGSGRPTKDANDARSLLLGTATNLSDDAMAKAESIVEGFEKMVGKPTEQNAELFATVLRQIMTSPKLTADVKKELVSVLAQLKTAIAQRLNDFSEMTPRQREEQQKALMRAKELINEAKSNFKPR